MGDDSIDMVISHIDMGYLVTLVGRRGGQSVVVPTRVSAALSALGSTASTIPSTKNVCITPLPLTRGLHSSTIQLNLSRF